MRVGAHVADGKDDNEEDHELVDGVADEGAKHVGRKQLLVSSVGLAAEEVILGVLGRERQRCKRVHDHVDPKELDGSEWTLLESKGADEAREKSDNIDRQLELEEPSDVVVHISSPAACLYD